MSFTQAVKVCFSKYVTFDGRAGRPEYWYWILFYIVAEIVALILDLTLTYGLLTGVVVVGSFLPGLAVMIRRLHDIDRSGWAWLISLVPAVGAILLIIWLCKPGTPGPNRFGPAPT